MRIKKGDNCIVIAGKDRGKKGVVLRVFPQDSKVLVEGINVQKKHVRARKSTEKGQVIEKSFPVHISNVMPIDPKTKKGTRIRVKEVKGKKVRVAVSGTEL